MNSLAERIRLAMERAGNTSQAALARAVGVKPPSINDWLTGKTRSIEGANLLRAARHLGVRPEWLSEGRGPMSDADIRLQRVPVEGERRTVDPVGGVALRKVDIPEFVEIMVLDAVGSMGNGHPRGEADQVVAMLPVSRLWLTRNIVCSSFDNLAFITGKGDSMSPTFSNGDILLVDKGARDMKVDAIYVLARDDELFIKRIQRLPTGEFLVLSDNPHYQSFRIGESERSTFHCLGRVLLAWNMRPL